MCGGGGGSLSESLVNDQMGALAEWNQWMDESLVNGVIGDMSHYRPQQSCEGYVFTGVCLSTGGRTLACLAGGIPACLAAGGVLSQHALQVVSHHALQQVSGGGCLVLGGPALGGLL